MIFAAYKRTRLVNAAPSLIGATPTALGLLIADRHGMEINSLDTLLQGGLT